MAPGRAEGWPACDQAGPNASRAGAGGRGEDWLPSSGRTGPEAALHGKPGAAGRTVPATEKLLRTQHSGYHRCCFCPGEAGAEICLSR